MNWNYVVQTGSAVAIYVALVGAFIADLSPLAFALYAAVLLSLWLSLFAIPASAVPIRNSAQPVESVIPRLSESLAELHALQNEINALQAQFVTHNNSHRISRGDSAL